MKKVSLTFKFASLLTGLVAILLGILGFWNAASQQQQSELEMLEKAQILATEMNAVWQFFETNQEQFVKDEQGNYVLYCVIAAKSVSTFFTADTDYMIHYTNLTTRRKADEPDGFELSALQSFSENSGIAEYYSMSTDRDGRQVFRYMQPIFMKESCLQCHGEPAGELDSFGYAKEGKQLDDLAGAVSITMPVDLYLKSMQENATRTTLFSGGILALGFILITLGMTKLVTQPLRKLEEAAESMGEGNLDIDVSGIGSRDEIHDLAIQFGKMAERLRQSYSHLESQVRERTSELASSNESLEEANRALEKTNSILEEQQAQLKEMNEVLRESNAFKSESLAVLSHELRTPLTSIIAFTEMWEKGKCDRVDNEPDNEAICEIRANSQLLLNMIDNILEVARSEAGRNSLAVEPVELVDLFNVVEKRFNFLAQKRSIEFTTRIDADVPIIMADWEKLRRILENLVANALKFTKFNGSVSLHAHNEARRGGVMINVIDNGIGISKENLPHVFEKYIQIGESSKRRYNGSGLGLAVVKDFVELHNGSVSVTSALNEGSTFNVFIPYGDNAWSDQGALGENADDGGGQNDDEDSLCR